MMLQWLKNWFYRYLYLQNFRSQKKLEEAVNKQLNRSAVEERIRSSLEKLSKNKDESKRVKILKVSKAFYGFFGHLIARYADLLPVERDIHREPRKPGDKPISRLQDEFVNKTESFHQQIYAAISSLIKLLSHIAPRSFVGQMPSASVTNFLDFLDGKITGISPQIEILKKSTGEYRTNYIDHTNQSFAHDWFTSSDFDGKCRIVYFTNSGGSGTLLPIPELSMYGISMHTPFPAETYCVPPHHMDTIFAFLRVILATFAYLETQVGAS